MEKKPFEFITYNEFLPGTSWEDTGSHTYEEAHAKMRRWYALDFLTALMEYVNGGATPNVNGELGTLMTYSLHRWAHATWKVTGVFSDNISCPFFFQGHEEAEKFLSYRGCDTSTIAQLNILYNVK